MFLNLIDDLTDHKRLGTILILGIPAFIAITLLMIVLEGILFGHWLVDIYAFKTLFYFHGITVGIWIAVLLFIFSESPRFLELEHRHKWLAGLFSVGAMIMVVLMIGGSFFLLVTDNLAPIGS